MEKNIIPSGLPRLRHCVGSFIAVAVIACLTTAIASSDTNGMEGAASPPVATNLEDVSYDISINGVVQGRGPALQIPGGLYISRTMAAEAHLLCGRTVSVSDIRLCAIPVTGVHISGRSLAATVPVRGFASTTVGVPTPPPALPELMPGRLSFVNYNLDASRVFGGFAYTGSFNGGLRMGDDAFDAGIVATRVASFDSGSYVGSDVLVTSAAYRREWFEQKLDLTVGRSALVQRGLIGSNLFDGITLAHSNINNVGDVQASALPPLRGFNSVDGVLTYRIGTSILKQVPLAAGPYSIDSSFFDGLPGGGHLEFTGIDGRVVSLDVPRTQALRSPLYQAGTYDWSLQAGRVQTAVGGFVAALSAGARYGITDNVSGEVGFVFDPKSGVVNSDFDSRLPAYLGSVGGSIAYEWKQADPWLAIPMRTPTAWALQSYYQKSFGVVSLDIDYERNANGGIVVGGYQAANDVPEPQDEGSSSLPLASSSSPVYGSSILEDVRIGLEAPLWRSGLSANVHYESTGVIGAVSRVHEIDAQLSGNLQHAGTWGAFVRVGRTSVGSNELSLNAFLTVPVGSRSHAGVTYQSDQTDGKKSSPDAYEISMSGSNDGHWAQSAAYNVTIDQLGNGSASYQQESADVSVGANLFKSSGQALSGTINASGSLVAADGHLIAGRAVNDSIVVLEAPALPRADVYQDDASKPTTRTDGSGFAVLSFLRDYKANSARIDDSEAPLGLENPSNVLTGTVYPHRGYVVRAATHLAKPARFFATYPLASKNLQRYAQIGNDAVPVESDGSFFVDDIAAIVADVSVSWPVDDHSSHCVIPLAAIKGALDQLTAPANVIPNVKGLQCQ